jgi:hemolysin activation/secretion protein
MNLRKTFTLTASILCISTVSFAAPSMPNIGDVLKQTEPVKDIPQQKPQVPEIKSDIKPAIKKSDVGSVFVKSFKVTGNTALSADKLESVANQQENINKDMSLAGMESVASQITRYYRSNGYFVARAYIPKQDMKDGVVEIAVLEGKYGEFHLKNDSLVRDKTVQGMLDDIKGQGVISTDTIERAMLIINDTHGASVTQADVRPGAEVGTSDFEIGVSATPRVSGYVIADNYGMRYTGKNRLIGGLSVNSPFGIGDRISLTGMTSSSGDVKNGKLAYSFPILYSGLTGGIAYSRTDYSLGEEYNELDATGKSDNLEMTMTYPVIRSRYETLNANFGVYSKQLKDEIEMLDIVTKKRTLSVTAGVDYSKQYRLFGLSNETSVSGTYTMGYLKFDDDADEAADKLGSDTNGTYNKINVEATQSTVYNKSFSTVLSFQGQYAINNKNLDGSEDLSIGGAYGVRVFPSGEKSGENGYILNAEGFYSLPVFKGFTNKFSLFVDSAYAQPADDNLNERGRQLTDAGVGYYMNYKTFFLKAHYARIIGGTIVESEPEYKDKYLIQAGLSF